MIYKKRTREARRFYGASTVAQPPFASLNYKAGDTSGVFSTGTATDGIALSPDLCRVYYAPMASNRAYSIPTSALRDFSLSVGQLNAAVTDHGRRPGGIHDGMAFSTNGRIH